MSLSNQEQVGFESRAGNTVAFLCSLVFHVTLLLVLACWMFVAGKPSEGLLLSADIGQSSETALDTIQTFELIPQVDELQSVDPASPLNLDVKIESLIEPPKTPKAPGLNSTFTSLSIGDVVDNLKEKTKGRGRGASFFGAYAEGNRFVYVLDSSRSMKGDRWTYACNQLIDSINGLNPGQEFFVICFDMETTFLFNKPPGQAEFLEVDNDIVARVRRWLRSRTLGPATMPAEALRYALDLNPDAVFLLSDGELQDNSQLMLRLINSNVASERRQIPIHTVHLFSLQGRMTLQQIALENSGTFTPIENQGVFGQFRRR